MLFFKRCDFPYTVITLMTSTTHDQLFDAHNSKHISDISVFSILLFLGS